MVVFQPTDGVDPLCVTVKHVWEHGRMGLPTRYEVSVINSVRVVTEQRTAVFPADATQDFNTTAVVNTALKHLHFRCLEPCFSLVAVEERYR